jgi:hypothetical protein
MTVFFVLSVLLFFLKKLKVASFKALHTAFSAESHISVL